jgi:hypothetical protein
MPLVYATTGNIVPSPEYANVIRVSAVMRQPVTKTTPGD